MGKYDDIIDHPHHVSPTHPQMPLLDRAAQFSPFAALTGYDAAVVETARPVDQKLILDEEKKQEINEALRTGQGRSAIVTYFEPDPRKEGGAYVQINGSIQKVDPYTKTVLIENQSIPFEDLYAVTLE